jgi:iron complex outermembrane receptor protein
MNARSLSIFLASASLLALGPAIPANAQATAQAEPAASGSVGLEEIVVTARRVQEKLQEVPVAVTAFTARDLEERQITSIDSFGQGVPNVYVAYTEFNNALSPFITIRGITGAGDEIAVDSPIGIYLDGVYMARQLGLAFDLVDLDQFEILRGPQGTLFGKNNIGGALSMTSKTPTGVLDGHLEMGFGNFDQMRVKASFDLPEYDGLSIRGTVLHKERGFVRTNPMGGAEFTFPEPTGHFTTEGGYSDQDENGGLLAVRYTGIDNLLVDIKGDYSESFDGGNATQFIGFSSADLASPVYGFLGAAARGRFGSVGPYQLGLVGTGVAQSSIPNWFVGDNGSDKAWGYSATVQYDFNDNLSLKNIAAFRTQRVVIPVNDIGGTALTVPPGGKTMNALASLINAATRGIVPGGFYANTNFAGPPGTPFCYSLCSFSQVQSSHTVSEELQLIGHEERFDWLAGFYYSDEIAFAAPQIPDGGGAIFPVMTFFPGGFLGNAALIGGGTNSVDNQSWAFYGHGTVHLTDAVDLSGGLRYTYDYRYFLLHNDYVPGSPPQKATSVSFDNVDWDISLTWKVMQDVNLYAKVSTGYLSGGVVAPAPFAPTYLTSYEAGMKSDWFDHRLRFNIDVFHTKQDDQQLQSLNLGQFGLPAGTPLGTIILSSLTPGQPLVHIHRNGIELEAQAIPVRGLTLGLNAGVVRTPVTSGITPSIPNKNLSLNAEYDFPKFDNDMYFAIRADSSWTSGYTSGGLSAAVVAASDPAFIADVRRPATWILDMRAMLADIPVGAAKGKISVWAKNLTDEQNLTFADDVGISTAGNYDLPRMYGVDLAIDF